MSNYTQWLDSLTVGDRVWYQGRIYTIRSADDRVIHCTGGLHVYRVNGAPVGDPYCRVRPVTVDDIVREKRRLCIEKIRAANLDGLTLDQLKRIASVVME